MFFVLVLSPKDGARARNRSICEFDYEHEHHFIEHEHEFKLKDVGKDEGVKPRVWRSRKKRTTIRSIRHAELESLVPPGGLIPIGLPIALLHLLYCRTSFRNLPS